jgi:CheY-like chemotaxis protein
MTAPRRILIVDDDAALLRLLSLRLQKEGFTVVEAASGEEALGKLAAAVPDLVITDMRMGGMDGITLFEAVRHHQPGCRVYHASSSEMFGQARESPQSEDTPFNPVNPYAAAKVYAHQMVRIYRGSYKLYIASGLLFNHESERRPLHFVTQKIAYGAACARLDARTIERRNGWGRHRRTSNVADYAGAGSRRFTTRE